MKIVSYLIPVMLLAMLARPSYADEGTLVLGTDAYYYQYPRAAVCEAGG